MNLPMKILSGGMILLFIASCAVQYNDPDPFTWIAAYGAAGLITGLAMAGRESKLPWAAGAIYLAWALWNMPKKGGNWFNIEEGRESIGLLICAVWMVVLAALEYRRAAKPAQN
jgi:hypothetical protein